MPPDYKCSLSYLACTLVLESKNGALCSGRPLVEETPAGMLEVLMGSSWELYPSSDPDIVLADRAWGFSVLDSLMLPSDWSDCHSVFGNCPILGIPNPDNGVNPRPVLAPPSELRSRECCRRFNLSIGDMAGFDGILVGGSTPPSAGLCEADSLLSGDGAEGISSQLTVASGMSVYKNIKLIWGMLSKRLFVIQVSNIRLQ